MATVFFYEKPGCANNTRQKLLLVAAGHKVIAKNILIEDWQTDRLRPFFGGKPVREWFNYSAPAIKHGDVYPDQLTEHEALVLMRENPILIRRPLIQVDDCFMAGFDQQTVDSWIGLKEIEATQDMETCTRSLAQASCSRE